MVTPSKMHKIKVFDGLIQVSFLKFHAGIGLKMAKGYTASGAMETLTRRSMKM